jgi:hypothetical protein
VGGWDELATGVKRGESPLGCTEGDDSGLLGGAEGGWRDLDGVCLLEDWALAGWPLDVANLLSTIFILVNFFLGGVNGFALAGDLSSSSSSASSFASFRAFFVASFSAASFCIAWFAFFHSLGQSLGSKPRPMMLCNDVTSSSHILGPVWSCQSGILCHPTTSNRRKAIVLAITCRPQLQELIWLGLWTVWCLPPLGTTMPDLRNQARNLLRAVLLLAVDPGSESIYQLLPVEGW